MKKILIIADGVTMAHVTRMDQLSRHLDRDQFEVYFAAPESYFHLLAFNPILAAPPIKIHSVPTAVFVDRLFKNFFPWTENELNDQLKENLLLIERIRPDFVIGDTRLSLSVACKRLNVLYYNLVNFQWHPNYLRPQLVPHAVAVEIFGRPLCHLVAPVVIPTVLKLHLRIVNKWLKSVGAKTVENIFDFYCQGDFLLFPDLPDFFPESKVPENGFFIAPLIWKSSQVKWPAHWNNIKQGQAKYAMLSMGSSGSTNLISTIIRALNQLDFEVLYSGSEQALSGLDRSKIHHANFFPMDEVLKLSSMAIGNGGIATTYQFLSEAIPFYSLPNNLDQYLNSSLLKKFGLSDHQHLSNFSEEKFKSQIRYLMNSADYKQNLLSTQSKIKNFNTPLNKIFGFANAKAV